MLINPVLQFSFSCRIQFNKFYMSKRVLMHELYKYIAVSLSEIFIKSPVIYSYFRMYFLLFLSHCFNNLLPPWKVLGCIYLFNWTEILVGWKLFVYQCTETLSTRHCFIWLFIYVRWWVFSSNAEKCILKLEHSSIYNTFARRSF